MMTHPNRGASFFLPHDNPQAGIISKGLTMWRGYSASPLVFLLSLSVKAHAFPLGQISLLRSLVTASLRPGPNKCFVNVDLSSQPMVLPGNLADVMLAYGRAKARGLGYADLAVNKMPSAFGIEIGRYVPSAFSPSSPLASSGQSRVNVRNSHAIGGATDSCATSRSRSRLADPTARNRIARFASLRGSVLSTPSLTRMANGRMSP
jgi:hypothetical protein